jgi:hypothetical protein
MLLLLPPWTLLCAGDLQAAGSVGGAAA